MAMHQEVEETAERVVPMAGDIALLVPVEEHWRVLDLTDPGRAVVVAPWVHHTVHVEGMAPNREGARVAWLSRLREDVDGLDVVLSGTRLPFRRGAFDLVMVAQSSPWSLSEARDRLRAGGWLIWIVHGPAWPRVALRSARSVPEVARSVRDWVAARVALEEGWQRELNANRLVFRRAYVHFKEYTWGFLPFDAPAVHRYYLDAVQEEGTGLARYRAKVARMLGRLGWYRYFASTYVVVARAGVPA